MAATGSAIASWAGSAAGVATIASAVVGVVGISQQQSSARDARNAAASSARQQEAIQADQKARAAAQSMQEQRQQIREERVRRARILQSAENTGVAESSGEIGALGDLSTGLATNLGFNNAEINRGTRMSNAGQAAADFNFQATAAMGRSANWGRVASMAGTIFQSGIKSFPTGANPPGTVDNSIFGTAGSGSRRIAD